MLVRTLLFLGAVGLDRTWDLRSYTGDGLGVLTGRPRAYGYFHTERFLSQIAQANGADTFTDGLAFRLARARRRRRESDQRLGGAHALDRVSRKRSHHPLQHKRWSLSTTSMGTASLSTLTR